MITTREMHTLPGTDYTSFPHRREIAAVALAIVPLFVDFSFRTSATLGAGRYSDFADVLLGMMLVIATLNNLSFIREGEAKFKTIRVIISVMLFAVAACHIASGFGLFVR